MKKSALRSVTATFKRRVGDKVAPVEEQPEADFDGAWKEAFKLYLSLFLDKFFPSIAANIDWRVKPVWLDKELSRVIGRAKSKAKVVDLLVRVGLKNGGTLRLLLHVEIQSAQEQNFAARLAEYNGGLTYVFHEPVVTLVVLLDWMVRLRPELEAELNRQIVLLEKEKKMRHITSMERQGMEIGRREGLKEGLKEGLREGLKEGLRKGHHEGHHQGLRQGQLSILIAQLQRQLGELPIRIRKQIESLPNEVIDEQGLEILDIKSMSELREWLKAHQNSAIAS